MMEDVTIRPIPPKPSLFPEQMAPPPEQPPAPRAFIPPAPERATNRPRRMPAIDELPRPAQAELRARRGEEDPDHPEKRKVSLLRQPTEMASEILRLYLAGVHTSRAPRRAPSKNA